MAFSYVNSKQTASERKAKYAYLRKEGKRWAWAAKARDWPWAKIFRLLGQTGDRRTARQQNLFQ